MQKALFMWRQSKYGTRPDNAFGLMSVSGGNSANMPHCCPQRIR
jgi:hypothetical protein